MFAVLRRFRAFGLVALLLTPGISGNLLQVLHPCPVDAPWLAHAPTSGAATAHEAGLHHASAAEAPGHHSQDAHKVCHCPGACCPSTLAAAPPVLAVRVAPLLETVHPRRPDAALAAPAGVPFDRLPPSTAPPLLG